MMTASCACERESAAQSDNEEGAVRRPNQLVCLKDGRQGQKSELANTAFRIEEKRYKLYKLDKKDARRRQRLEEPTDFSAVIDMRAPETCLGLLVPLPLPTARPIFAFAGVPGLFLLPNAITEDVQRQYARNALTTYANSALHPNNVVGVADGKATSSYEVGMRWATLGYSYNWTARTYDPEIFSSFPAGLGDLMRTFCSDIATGLGLRASDEPTLSTVAAFVDDIRARGAVAAKEMGQTCQLPFPTVDELRASFVGYEPQTAIVNYFPVGSQMMAHQDVSERSMHRPLVSLSLGCTSVFLMGTDSRDDKPFAFFLRSGDVAVFTGPSRTAYHAVPRILDDTPKALLGADLALDGATTVAAQPMLGLRININVRQVYDEPEPRLYCT